MPTASPRGSCAWERSSTMSSANPGGWLAITTGKVDRRWVHADSSLGSHHPAGSASGRTGPTWAAPRPMSMCSRGLAIVRLD
jgi:hypothetical protein